MPVWDPDVRRVALTHFTAEQMSGVYFFEDRAMVMSETSVLLRDGWSTFTVLDPANGNPSEVDRSNARLAAIKVIDHIRLLGYADPAEAMAALAVPEAEWKRPNFRDGMVDDCGLINNWR